MLIAYFYAYIPMLLGIVGIAAGLKTAIGHPGATLTTGPAVALAGGVTLFLAGDVLFRRPAFPASQRGAPLSGLRSDEGATREDSGHRRPGGEWESRAHVTVEA